jgi:hypothetical protein
MPEAGELEQHRRIVYQIQTELADGGTTINKLENLTDQEIVERFNVEGAEEIQMVRDTISEISSSEGYDLVVKIDQE